MIINWIAFSTFVSLLSLSLLGLGVDLSYYLVLAPKLERHQQVQLSTLPSWQQWLPQNLGQKLSIATASPQLTEGPSSGGVDTPLPKPSLQQKRLLMALGALWTEKAHTLSSSESLRTFFSNLPETFWKRNPPDPMDLVIASQIHLGSSIKQKSELLAVAAIEVHQLHLLLLKSESIDHVRASLSIADKLRQIQSLYPEFVKLKILDDSRSWVRHLQQTHSYLSHLSAPETLTQVFLSKEIPFAFCPIFHDRQKSLLWEREFLKPKWPGEPNFATTVSLIEQIEDRASKICEQYQKPTPLKATLTTSIPYYRRLFALQHLLRHTPKL